MFPDFNSFRQVFRQLTEDFGAMVIKNRGSRTNLFDKIAFFKAPDLGKTKLKFGCKQFRKYHDNNYNKDWEQDEFQMDYEEYLLEKKRSKGKINVKKMFKDDEKHNQHNEH
jgi:hypothetical protein